MTEETTPEVEMPEGVSLNDLIEHYKTSQSVVSTPAEPQPAVPPSTPKIPDPPSGLTAADMDRYASEFTRDGKLSDDTYTELQSKYGVAREVADQFVQGQQALAQQTVQDVTSVVGGPAGFEKLANWAAANLPAEEVAAINTMLAADPATAKQALLGLQARHKAHAGPDEGGVSGGRSPGGVKPIESREELQELIGHPDFKTNKGGFRDKVQARLDVTDSNHPALRLHR